MADVTRNAGRIEFLDAARGVAALAVVLYHGFSGDGLLLTRLMVNVENLGSTAVCTFFFVSGFIIPVSMGKSSLRQFWRSRFFRLFPVFWLASLLLMVLFWMGYVALDPAFHHFHAKLFLSNLSMTALVFRQPAILAQGWTLTVELFFYVLCTLLQMVGLLVRRITVLVAAMAAYLLWLGAAALRWVRPDHFKGEWGALLLAAFLGSVCYGVEKGQIRSRTLYWLTPPFLACALLGTWFDGLPIHSTNVSTSSLYSSWILATVLFFALFALRGRQFSRVLLWLGRISYSLYLLHGVTLLTIGRMRDVPPMISGALAVVTAIVLADLSYRFVERPLLKLARGSHRQSVAAVTSPVLSQ